MSDLVVARNCCMARMLPGEAELVSERTGLPGRAKSVKRFELYNGLDTALYKNYLYLFFTHYGINFSMITDSNVSYQSLFLFTHFHLLEHLNSAARQGHVTRAHFPQWCTADQRVSRVFRDVDGKICQFSSVNP